MTTLYLLKNYFKSAFRNLRKNRLFTTINVAGLAISLSVGLLVVALVTEVNTYDTFHAKADRIYRINTAYSYLGEEKYNLASTSVRIGKLLQDSVAAGVEDVLLMRSGFSGDVANAEKTIPLEGLYASNSFFNIFSFPLIKGNPATVLDEPYKLVLTESSAKKLFGDAEALGSTLTIEEKEYIVSGIAEDVPYNSHLKFDMLTSFSMIEQQEKDNTQFMQWTNVWNNYVYLLVPEHFDMAVLNGVLVRINETENVKDEYVKCNVSLQALNDIVPGKDLSNQIGPNMDASLLWMISGLAFIVILSACFNYTNLSIARALRRAKEVGMRKVIGASGFSIFIQFIMESVLIAMIGLLIAIGLFYVLKPQVMSMDNFLNGIVNLDISPAILVRFVIIAIVTGILAGLLPALFFSKLSPKLMLQSGEIKMFKGLTMRKLLIIFQFTLSLMFIISATIEYRQYRYSLNFDLGYSTDNIINLRANGIDMEVLKHEFSKLPEVKDLSSSRIVTSVGNYWATKLKYKDPQDSINVYYNDVDANYLPLHAHHLLFGNNFNSGRRDTSIVQIVVNEEVLHRFDIPIGEEAIGEKMDMGGTEAEIVGVVADFHYGTTESEIKPFCFRYHPEDTQVLNLKVVTTDMLGFMDKLKSTWAGVDDVHPMEAQFYSDQIEDTYSEYSMMMKIIGFLAFLAITIAVVGLFGMVLFTTETKLKEISIRKIFGASEGSLIFLVGKGFMLLLLISMLVAIPATYYLFDQFVFSDIVYRVSIGVFETFTGPVVVLGLAMLTVGFLTLIAARSNPASILRNK